MVKNKYRQMTSKEMWTKIINDARWYDGSPQTLVQIIEHFETQGYRISQILDKQRDDNQDGEFKKQLPVASEEEIIEGAKRLWKLPAKLDAVKQIMRLGYGLKDAKIYCEKNFD